MHFGSCKVPLYLLMRQNQRHSKRTEEFEVYESENAERVGKLHLTLENMGREIKMSKKADGKTETVPQGPRTQVSKELSKEEISKSFKAPEG